MRHAVKSKIVKAYCLGENSEMEQQLLQEGTIRKREDGSYELFSREAVNGSGQIAHAGDYFKVDHVDGKNYPYPNAREYFLKNHRHISGDEYVQNGSGDTAYAIWQDGDESCEEIRFLLDTGRLTISPDTPDKYYNAFLWGTLLNAGRDATVVFYGVTRDSEGKITDIDFNLVARQFFEENYVLCKE